MSTVTPLADSLQSQLVDLLGSDAVFADPAEREAYSADVYSAGATCALVIRPRDKQLAARAVGIITSAGHDVIGRGGGMSYTGGYIPLRPESVIVDTSALNRIVEINADDMYVTVEAGVTWQQIYEALKPRGLRLPCFGTFSGQRATVGGGLSNGALFMATARYGTAAEMVLGLEVALADGTILRTGQAGFANVSKPFYRTYGPDLTGLFVHDTGAMGVKLQATLRLIRRPAELDYASFVFADIETAASALSEVARADVAEEAYVFDPESTRKNLAGGDLAQDLKTLAGVVKGQSSLLKGLKEGAKLVAAGRNFIEGDVFSLHVVCAGRNAAAVASDVAACRAIAVKFAGKEIVNSIPKAVRAMPFPVMNAVLGPEGDRWAALNAKVAHSDAHAVIRGADRILDEYREEMAAKGVTLTRLLIAISNHAFSYEPVFHWHDRWLPVHRRTPEPQHLAKLTEPAANPAAAELVQRLRVRLVNYFAEIGAASNQIGKTYPYATSLLPTTRALLESLKAVVDPIGRMNPGALGFAVHSPRKSQ
ncbi:MAG: FAD-binding oxidoreductase [Steroidobacteraceae bacterium]